MWKEQKRQRFQELRQRESAGELGEAEHAELTLLLDELQTAEVRYLGPATQRLQDEREIVQEQNRVLETLLRREEKRVGLLTVQLERLETLAASG